MKMRALQYVSIALLASPLFLSGCGEDDKAPIPTPGPARPTNTATRPPATPTATVPVATATPTSAVPTPTATTAPQPTATPTTAEASPTPTHTTVPPTATATPEPAGGPGIVIGDVTAAAGQQTSVTATLSTGGSEVAGTQNDITFAAAGNRSVTIVRRPNGRPDCSVNPEINKGSTTFAFQPPGCTAETCTAVRAIVFSSEDVDPIPDGSVLYSCRVQIASDAAPGNYPLTISGTILSNPAGQRVCGPAAGNPPCTGDRNGSVTVQ